MALYLLDTTTFSYVMRDHAVVHARIAGLTAGDRLTICSTVRGEILYGIGRLPQGTRRRTLEAKALQLFPALVCEPILPAAADHDAILKRTAEIAGTPLDENDLWIAATAQSLGAVLVTTDQDYARLVRARRRGLDDCWPSTLIRHVSENLRRDLDLRRASTWDFRFKPARSMLGRPWPLLTIPRTRPRRSAGSARARARSRVR